MTDGDRIAAGLIAGAVVIWLYMSYRAPILLAVSVIALTIATLATVSILLMSRGGVVTGGRHITGTLLCLYPSFALGIVNVMLLWKPPQGGELFREFVQTFAQEQKFSSFDAVIFVAYQICGAGAFLGVALFSISFAMAIMAAVNLHVRAWGRPAWQFIFRYTSFSWARRTTVAAVLLSALSIYCSGGWLFEAMQALLSAQHINDMPLQPKP